MYASTSYQERSEPQRPLHTMIVNSDLPVDKYSIGSWNENYSSQETPIEYQTKFGKNDVLKFKNFPKKEEDSQQKKADASVCNEFNVITSGEAVTIVGKFRLLHKLIVQADHGFNDTERNLFGFDESNVCIFPNTMNLSLHIVHSHYLCSFVCDRLWEMINQSEIDCPEINIIKKFLKEFDDHLSAFALYESYAMSHVNGVVFCDGCDADIKNFKQDLNTLIDNVRKSEYYIITWRQLLKRQQK